MTKHTPGPWAVMETHTGALSINVSPQVPISTVGGAGWHLGEETARANARLIATAPDLLDMCERLLNFTLSFADPWAVSAAGDGILASAKALIAQAKGEG